MEFNKSINRNFKIDKNISYFIGVLHSDGCIYIFNHKGSQRKIFRLNLTVGDKSIPMALKFKEILYKYFGKKVNLRKVPKKNSHVIQTSINKSWYIFQNWINMNLSKEIKNNPVLFGAYLAGLIDGDGYIKLKNNKDRVIPQCVIIIANDHPLNEIGNLIKNYLNCEVHFEFDKRSKGVSTCFYVSNKNIKFIKNYVCPHISLPYKLNKLKDFFEIKNGPARI